MNGIKIEELDTISSVTLNNVLPIVDSNNETKKVTVTQLKTKIVEDITNLHFLIVQSLPTQDIETNVIYLVPKNPSGTNDVYTEYTYINNNWEKLGETQIDLSGYVTTSTLTSSYYNKSEVDSAISTAIGSTLGGSY